MATEHERIFAEFEQRMKALRELEEKEDSERAERLRQEYLRRTGRKEMQP